MSGALVSFSEMLYISSIFSSSSSSMTWTSLFSNFAERAEIKQVD